MSYKIIHEHNHYVVYIEGKFYCMVDSLKEADEEIRDYYAERR